MATEKQAGVKRMRMAERAQHQLDIHFPGFEPRLLWQRKSNDGYTTVPRTMPLVAQAIDAQTKGQPAGHTLICLWMRAPDHPLIVIESPAVFAAEAGFEGERAVDTWRRRMRSLKALGFIDSKPGATGDFHYVLLLNPNVAVEKLRQGKLVQDGLYARFVDRLSDIGGYRDIVAFREYETEQKLKAAAARHVTAKTAPSPASSSAATAPVSIKRVLRRSKPTAKTATTGA